MFAGNHELSIDAKSRLFLPAAVRTTLATKMHGPKLYLTPGRRKGTLSLFGNEYLEAYAAKYLAPLEFEEGQEDLLDMFYSMAELLELDKQGRVVLPQRTLEFAGIGRQVTLTGARDHLVIWKREHFEAFKRARWNDYPGSWRRTGARPAAGPKPEPDVSELSAPATRADAADEPT
jgi:MraZ protein